MLIVSKVLEPLDIWRAKGIESILKDKRRNVNLYYEYMDTKRTFENKRRILEWPENQPIKN
jgi:hypothetical protein